MSDYKQFVENAKSDLKKLREDLDELDQQIKADCRNANAWYRERMEKLREDQHNIDLKIMQIAEDNHSDIHPSYQAAISDAERHYQALSAAVEAYRKKVESNAGES